MDAPAIAKLYIRDLDKIKNELERYTSEEAIWKISEGISNSAGNLCLHIIGSINHFIGFTIGKTGYVREREVEFSTKGIRKEILIAMIEESKKMIELVVAGLPEEELKKEYSFDFAGKNSTEHYLIFFIAHLNYHLGQINYHRRLLNQVS